jgi:hypothetical protein
MRIEICTDVDGVEFGECCEDRVTAWDDMDISAVSLEKLRTNNLANGRQQDLDDLQHVGEGW